MKSSVDVLNALREAQGHLETQILRLAEPSRQSGLKIALLGLLLAWAAFSLTRGLWLLLPVPTVTAPAAKVINPPTALSASSGSFEVDLDSMLDLALFGDAVEAPGLPELDNTAQTNPREGIEAGARETQLNITLTGIVASTKDGLGSVMIERSGTQALYGVGDSIAGLDGVKLAKVMSRQVVLENRGTYELLKLFEENALPIMVQQATVNTTDQIGTGEKRPSETSNSAAVARPAEKVLTVSQARQVAQYRDRLYSDPQSLATLVSVSAVREGGQLRGYRISPGVDPKLFSSLGLKSGDIITAVNGYALSDPANTATLYQIMRDVRQATIEIERDGVAVSMAIDLDK